MDREYNNNNHVQPPQLPDSYSMGLRRLYNDCMQQEWRRRPSASEILLRDIVQVVIISLSQLFSISE